MLKFQPGLNFVDDIYAYSWTNQLGKFSKSRNSFGYRSHWAEKIRAQCTRESFHG